MRNLLPSILTLLMLSAVASHVQSQQPKSSQTFASFWVQFKTAVATNDKEAVAEMTKFPFYWGQELTRGKFIKKYSEIFDRKTQRCFAKEKPVNDYQSHLAAVKLTKKHSAPAPAPQQDTGSYSVFCGDTIYSFEKVAGKYKFTGTGADD